MEIEPQSFDPEEFFSLASTLVSEDPSEGCLRTAISCAYYACHLTARSRLMLKQWQPRGSGQDHGGIMAELRTRNKRAMADQLAQLRELREHADYHLTCGCDKTNETCEICRCLRESGDAASGGAVTQQHWTQADEIVRHLLPNLKVF